MSARENSRLILQSDWQDALREAEGTAWITYKKPGESTSIHGELTCHGLSVDQTPYITPSQGFAVDKVLKVSLLGHRISVSYEDAVTKCSCHFQAPSDVFMNIHQTSVLSMDVSRGGLGVSSDSRGNLSLWTSDNGDVRRRLEGHCGDVYSCRFFPSGLVVLSGGADSQLKVWSAETGKCAVTLTGHQAGIMDTTIVDKGRNVLSASRDGSAKLWDVGQSQCLTTFKEVGGIINSCALDVVTQEIALGKGAGEHSEREVATEGKMLLLGIETGSLQGFGLYSREKIFDLNCHSAVNCCCFVSDNLVCCGTQDGCLYLLDLRNTETPLQVIKESRSAILSLQPCGAGVFVGTGDGSCFLMTGAFQTDLELTGSDCDPIYSIAADGSYIYSACRDKTIRRYSCMKQ
ncbi:hypothetical protein CAPTEDRAFT_111827 [Capitella teleta]|uniref:Uncharacterized protein n=1 Tax=Capitella teleta TaxID=283909 RepID=X1YV63_CAPTE|nr:hypothetical protein CAPTEDRAFT_111827 [Capitella teleta]|eukprot:ELU04701.1 hypothetical protein CAPTEDRAFT_111827 [Capitella teleta]